MNLTTKIMTAVFAGLMALSAHAGVTLNAARVGAEDVAALAKFYQDAFGLQEVNRLEFPGMLEIMLNFGDTVETAKANGNAQVVIMHRATNAIEDPVPHLIFNVTDIAATAAAITTAGGKMDGEPRAFGNTGMMIGFGSDPAGNRFELIQAPQKKPE
jgi:predicted enzyme related to lactoylglutathione lyase